MRFLPTPLPGCWVVELERLEDERGWFARTFDAEEFRRRGLDATVAQCNASFNPCQDTIRGLHYQAEPHGESKLVRCVRGEIFDVAVDLRMGSESYCRWFATELSAENGRMLFIPAGLAHGFQTLSVNCEVLYQMGSAYVPGAARGVRWDDPAFGVKWPPATAGLTISAKDRAYPDFQREDP
jgi:dTDP-4-dehydrorhamnose 3,5-epimerase